MSGELQLELAPGHQQRLEGRVTVSAQRSGLGLPRPAASIGRPPLSFATEPEGRMVLKLHQEGRRSEALAYLPAAPRTTALFKLNAPTIGSFEKTFGVSPKDWLERMTVVSESCVIDKGTQPPQTPAPGDVSGQHSTSPKLIAVNGKVLGAKLV